MDSNKFRVYLRGLLRGELPGKKQPVEENLAIAQDRETEVQWKQGEHFSYRFAYARSSDSQKAGDPGQDYLSFYHDIDTFIFAVCDGVSQSFYGDLAARFIGEALVGWLGDGMPGTLEVELIEHEMSSALQKWTNPASRMINDFQLPPDIPDMLRVVLEEKKRMGSESTFICGRLDWPNHDFPQGRAVLAWMGDSRLRIWEKEQERSAELQGEFATMQRWSSRRGQVGSGVHVYAVPLLGHDPITRLMAYTDGLSLLDDINRVVTNAELQEYMDMAGQSATSDDIAFLEIIIEAGGAGPAR